MGIIAQKGENYRDISLLNTVYKFYTNMIHDRLKTDTELILEEHNGIRKGRSCNNKVFTIKK